MADTRVADTKKDPVSNLSEQIADALGVIAVIAGVIIAGSQYKDRIRGMFDWVAVHASDGYQWVRAQYRTTLVAFTRHIVFRAFIILAVFQIAELVLLHYTCDQALGGTYWFWWFMKVGAVFGSLALVIRRYWQATELEEWSTDASLSRDQFIAKYGERRSPITGWIVMIVAFLIEGVWLMATVIAMHTAGTEWVWTVPISALSFFALALALGVYLVATAAFGAVIKTIEAVCGVFGVTFRVSMAAALPGLTQQNVMEKIRDLDPGLAKLGTFLAKGHYGIGAGIGLMWALVATLPYVQVVMVGLVLLLVSKTTDWIFTNHGIPTEESRRRSFRLASHLFTAAIAVWSGRLLWAAFGGDVRTRIEMAGFPSWRWAIVGLVAALAVFLALAYTKETAATTAEPGKVSLKPVRIIGMVLAGAFGLYMMAALIVPHVMPASSVKPVTVVTVPLPPPSGGTVAHTSTGSFHCPHKPWVKTREFCNLVSD